MLNERDVVRGAMGAHEVSMTTPYGKSERLKQLRALIFYYRLKNDKESVMDCLELIAEIEEMK